MDAVSTLASVLGLALAAGVNLYAVVLVAGVGIRFHWLSGLPPEMAVLAHPVVLGLAGLLYLLEFAADKIPFVTPIWDALHTFVRPLGGAALAVAALGNAAPIWQVGAGLLGGTLALGTHVTKMGFRLAAHAIPEPATHSAISLGEDLSVAGLVLLVFQYPGIALVAVLMIVTSLAVALPWLVRNVRRLALRDRTPMRVGSQD
jgi:hypothetical protein